MVEEALTCVYALVRVDNYSTKLTFVPLFPLLKLLFRVIEQNVICSLTVHTVIFRGC